MFKKNKEQDLKKLDIDNINQSVNLLHKILKIGYILIFLIGFYALFSLLKELHFFSLLKTILKVLTPFFIGLIIAWLFNPIVSWLSTKKINRNFAVIIVYLIFVGLLILMVSAIIPLIIEQINELVAAIPSTTDKLLKWIDGIFRNLDGSGIDLDQLKSNVLLSLTDFGKNLTNQLPAKTMGMITKFFSFVGVFVLGLMIGFYMLFNFDTVNKSLISFFPKKIRKDAEKLTIEINTSLLHFVQGTLFVSSIIFITNYIGFLIIGVKAPLLFAAFCGITNIIPYAGPYLGGIPVTLVAFSQDPVIGTFTLIYVICIQVLEGNFISPIVMSKTMKLSPVTILIGLLIGGYFFGIVGMVAATPIIAVSKTIFLFFDQKYQLTKYQSE